LFQVLCCLSPLFFVWFISEVGAGVRSKLRLIHNNGLYMGNQTRGNGTYIFGAREEWIAFTKLFILNTFVYHTFQPFLPYLKRKMSCLVVILYMLLTVTAQVSPHLSLNTKILRLRYPGCKWMEPGMTLDIRGMIIIE
jgi:hypothetical protein